MKPTKTLMIITALFLIATVSAMTIDFYYSKTCPHCQSIYPIVVQQAERYPSYQFNFLDVSEHNKAFVSKGFTGVPAFVINTDDGREIKFTGANAPKLNCELEEMTTESCPTYSADTCTKESWFKI